MMTVIVTPPADDVGIDGEPITLFDDMLLCKYHQKPNKRGKGKLIRKGNGGNGRGRNGNGKKHGNRNGNGNISTSGSAPSSGSSGSRGS